MWVGCEPPVSQILQIKQSLYSFEKTRCVGKFIGKFTNKIDMVGKNKYVCGGSNTKQTEWHE